MRGGVPYSRVIERRMDFWVFSYTNL
jgi:hypothetical protein